jgi:hypothetical protein
MSPTMEIGARGTCVRSVTNPASCRENPDGSFDEISLGSAINALPAPEGNGAAVRDYDKIALGWMLSRPFC